MLKNKCCTKFSILDISSGQNIHLLTRSPIFTSKRGNSSIQRPKIRKNTLEQKTDSIQNVLFVFLSFIIRSWGFFKKKLQTANPRGFSSLSGRIRQTMSKLFVTNSGAILFKLFFLQCFVIVYNCLKCLKCFLQLFVVLFWFLQLCVICCYRCCSVLQLCIVCCITVCSCLQICVVVFVCFRSCLQLFLCFCCCFVVVRILLQFVLAFCDMLSVLYTFVFVRNLLQWFVCVPYLCVVCFCQFCVVGCMCFVLLNFILFCMFCVYSEFVVVVYVCFCSVCIVIFFVVCCSCLHVFEVVYVFCTWFKRFVVFCCSPGRMAPESNKKMNREQVVRYLETWNCQMFVVVLKFSMVFPCKF